MRYQNIVLATLLMFGFANSSCNKRFSLDTQKEINIIANKFKITPCLAGDVYNYLSTSYALLHSRRCYSVCEKEANLRLKGIRQNIMDEVLNMCTNKCIADNIDNDGEL